MGIVLRWMFGLCLISWRYLWQTTPLHRREETGDTSDLPPPLPEHVTDERDQSIDDGVGPLFHRRFSVRIDGAHLDPAQLIDELASDLNRAVPWEIAAVRGEPGPFDPGHEFVVRIASPWDGPVRVVHRDRTSFRLATLVGHLEAGQIEFSARADGATLHFEIEVWARPGSRTIQLLYTRLRLAKEMQLSMWVRVCMAAAEIAQGRVRGGVHISTRRVAAGALPRV